MAKKVNRLEVRTAHRATGAALWRRLRWAGLAVGAPALWACAEHRFVTPTPAPDAAAADVIWLATLPQGATEPYGELIQYRRIIPFNK